LGRGLGLRPLTRTTRSVAPTEAGERLLRTVGPRLDEVDAELAALSELRDKPAGTIRITAGEHAAESILWPAVARLLPQYPDIKVEIVVDYGLTNIVAERYDAGVRLGEQVAKGMIAVRIGPDVYLAPRSRSDTKQKILRGYLTASGAAIVAPGFSTLIPDLPGQVSMYVSCDFEELHWSRSAALSMRCQILRPVLTNSVLPSGAIATAVMVL